MIFETLESALGVLLGDGGQTTVILVLAVAILYFRKAVGLGSMLADWTGKVVFSLGVLLALLVTGIVPGINVQAAISLAESMWSAIRRLLVDILGLTEFL